MSNDVVNKIVDVFADLFCEKILMNQAFVDRLSAKIIDRIDLPTLVLQSVNHSFNTEIENKIDETVKFLVDEAMSNINIADEIEIFLSREGIDAENINDFDEAVCKAVRNAL